VSARQDGRLGEVAGELGLELVEVFGGGELGAALVRDRSDGRELVLKVLPGEVWARRFARGAALSARVRSSAYPVPRYVGTGVSSGVSWSLQERLAGEVPEVMSAAHARQLLALVRRHADAADREADVLARFDRELGDALARVGDVPDAAPLARELADALALRPTSLRTHDVVHGDFHHRNYLAIGDQVTGVFDWDLAWVGDWRIDLVNLACWSSWVPSQIPPAVARLVVEAVMAECEADLLALLTAFHTLTVLDFNVREHPDRVPWQLGAIDGTTRRWLDPGDDDGGARRAAITVRDAVEDDAPAVARIYVDSWNDGFGAIVGMRDLDGDQVVRWAGELVAGTRRWWVAERAGRVVGFAGVGPSRDPVGPGLGELDTIAVDPGEWRTGIGRALMDVALGSLARAFTSAVVWTVAGDDRGHRFYEATGWVLEGRRRADGREVCFRHDL